KNYSVKELSFNEPNAAARLKNGDFSKEINEFKTKSSDYLLIDFGNMKEVFDVWEFVSQIGLLIKTPVIIKSESPEIIDKFLRYYPGKAGVVLSENTKMSVLQLKHYGALIVNSDLEPIE
ncbi:MAG: homocysteine methyltransferase, partial [Bacillota bacterium]|nr:homocysteine methyltransferase [Bacillota bacterium]